MPRKVNNPPVQWFSLPTCAAMFDRALDEFRDVDIPFLKDLGILLPEHFRVWPSATGKNPRVYITREGVEAIDAAGCPTASF